MQRFKQALDATKQQLLPLQKAQPRPPLATATPTDTALRRRSSIWSAPHTRPLLNGPQPRPSCSLSRAPHAGTVEQSRGPRLRRLESGGSTFLAR